MTKKSVQQFYEENREAVLRIVHDERKKPVTHSQLTERYQDSKGNVYYVFPNLNLPVERLGELQKYMQWIGKGLTSEEDDEIDDSLAKVLMSDAKEHEKKIKFGAIMAEKKKRKAQCIHTELYYNYLAVQWVRQDENPEYFDNDIQKEKVEQFKQEVRAGGSYAFFQNPEFKKLNDLLKLSERGWSQLWQESLISQTLLRPSLNHLVSANLSASKKKISKVS